MDELTKAYLKIKGRKTDDTGSEEIKTMLSKGYLTRVVNQVLSSSNQCTVDFLTLMIRTIVTNTNEENQKLLIQSRPGHSSNRCLRSCEEMFWQSPPMLIFDYFFILCKSLRRIGEL